MALIVKIKAQILSHDPHWPGSRKTKDVTSIFIFSRRLFTQMEYYLATGYYYYYCITLSFLSLAFQMRSEQRQRLHSQHSSCAALRLRPQTQSTVPGLVFLSHTQTRRYTAVLCTNWPIRYSVSGAGPLRPYERLTKAQTINISSDLNY